MGKILGRPYRLTDPGGGARGALAPDRLLIIIFNFFIFIGGTGSWHPWLRRSGKIRVTASAGDAA